jgi:hypothetical protein
LNEPTVTVISPNEPTGTAAISCPNAGSAARNAENCPVGKSTVIGSSIGAFLVGTLIAGFLGVYLGLRQPKKQPQGVAPNAALHHSGTEWRTELDAYSPAMRRPEQIGERFPTYEIDGRQVSSLD